MSAEQDPDPCSCFCSSHPWSFQTVLSRSLGSCSVPSSHCFTYLLTKNDRTTHWLEVALLSSITAESRVQGFSLHLGCNVWSSSCSYFRPWCTIHILRLGWSLLLAWDFSIYFTTSFHPQSNGIIERFHRSLKTALCARLAGSDWFLHLPLVLLGLCSVRKEDTGFSFFEAVFGSPLTIPGGW